MAFLSSVRPLLRTFLVAFLLVSLVASDEGVHPGHSELHHHHSAPSGNDDPMAAAMCDEQVRRVNVSCEEKVRQAESELTTQMEVIQSQLVLSPMPHHCIERFFS